MLSNSNISRHVYWTAVYKFKQFKPSGSLKCSEAALLRVGFCWGGMVECVDCGSSSAMNTTSGASAGWLDAPIMSATTLCVLCGFLKQYYFQQTALQLILNDLTRLII